MFCSVVSNCMYGEQINCVILLYLYRMKFTRNVELLRGILNLHSVSICLALCLQKQRLLGTVFCTLIVWDMFWIFKEWRGILLLNCVVLLTGWQWQGVVVELCQSTAIAICSLGHGLCTLAAVYGQSYHTSCPVSTGMDGHLRQVSQLNIQPAN